MLLVDLDIPALLGRQVEKAKLVWLALRDYRVLRVKMVLRVSQDKLVRKEIRVWLEALGPQVLQEVRVKMVSLR